MEHNNNNNMSSSQDEISLFLHQILLRSSSSSSMPGSINQLQDGKISALDSTSRSNHAINVTSSSVGAGGGGLSGNDTDEYDCESEVLLLLFSTLQVSTFLFMYSCGVPSFYIFFITKYLLLILLEYYHKIMTLFLFF